MRGVSPTNLLGKVLHIFTSTVSAWYRRSNIGGKTGSVTVIQRSSSDLRLNPHFHTLFLDGVYASNLTGAVPDDETSTYEPPAGEAGRETPIFMVESTPTQEDVESVVHQARKRILRYLEKRGVITFAVAPSDGEVNAPRAKGLSMRPRLRL